MLLYQTAQFKLLKRIEKKSKGQEQLLELSSDVFQGNEQLIDRYVLHNQRQTQTIKKAATSFLVVCFLVQGSDEEAKKKSKGGN